MQLDEAGRRHRSRPTYSATVIDSAVKLVLDGRQPYRSQWSAIEAVALEVGCTTETLRRWVRQAEGSPTVSRQRRDDREAFPKPATPAVQSAAPGVAHFPNNARLRELVEASGKTQREALRVFNLELQARPYSESAWKAFLATPGTPRFRALSSAMLSHAEKQFAKG